MKYCAVIITQRWLHGNIPDVAIEMKLRQV